jgi:alkanesulfonate monooxygenase SsuD/methylene tetrahydromethanopterin reductase-like flavin-dependent oxidoreductase (luciferase family)
MGGCDVKVGVSLFAQNYVDWDRFEQAEAQGSGEGLPQLVPDAQIYREQFHLGKLTEPLGFDSLWTVEHHFTPYTMINNPTQFLAYFAGCTERIDMGTMVVVLPWHDPVAVAEGFVALDHMLGGRSLKVGLGRGLGIREYNGHRVPMEESRERFKESLDVLRASLSSEWFSYDGEYVKVGPTTLRPRPRPDSRLLEDLYIAWGSPSSMPVAAHENCKPLFIPQRLWEDHRKELGEYNRIRVEEHGWKPERPTVVCWVYCAETDAEAEEGARRYITEYGDSALRHYQFLGEHLQGLKGYEYYAQMAKMRASMPEGADTAAIYLQNNIWGSPKTCLEKLESVNNRMGADEFVAVFSYGSMPVDVAEKNMRLFAEKVLPATQAFKLAEPPLLVS